MSTVQQSLREAVKDTSLGDLELKRTLGTGTFGRVRLCFDRKSRQYFAMKAMNKKAIVHHKQVEHVRNERAILMGFEHPFVVNMLKTFQDDRSIYLLLEYVPGGEFFSHLRRRGRLPNDVAKFYAAEIALIFKHLHSYGIVYRDLKPENILLDQEGHVKLADFGFAKRLTDDRTYTLCGTPEYLAPEVILQRGHGKAVDWWTLGVLLYEMLVGYPPFYDENNDHRRVYEKILAGQIHFPSFVDPYAKDLIKRLLTHERSRRLGSLAGAARDVLEHRWFRGVDWAALLLRKTKAPIVPAVKSPDDTSNFDQYAEEKPHRSDVEDTYYELFKDF